LWSNCHALLIEAEVDHLGNILLLFAVFMGANARAGFIDPELESTCNRKTDQDIPVILTLNDRVDLSAFKTPTGGFARPR